MKAPRGQPWSHPVAVTADDWGLSRGVNEGILELAAAGVVRRVSILACAAQTAYRLDELVATPEIELGLHLNFTYGAFEHGGSLLGHRGPVGFLLRWLGTGLDGGRILADETLRQIRALGGLGVRPGYLDGHHHVHLMPGVLRAIGPILSKRGIRGIRRPAHLRLWSVSKLPVLVLGVAAEASARRAGLSSLPCVYPGPADYAKPERLARTIEALAARFGELEVICHPAAFDDLGDLEFPDPYRAERVVEFEALRELGRSASGSPDRAASESSRAASVAPPRAAVTGRCVTGR